jgi:hypothetical protein
MQNEIKGLVKLPVRYDEPRSSFIDANGLVIFNTKSFYPYHDRHKLGHALAALINAKEEENPKKLSVPYLMKLHPELSEQEAAEYLAFCKSKTISYKECYGDGSIMMPEWKEYKSKT